ncbi:MAG TPA: protein kinase [Vicinamibacteria bacterium]|nr:protein kinase [Vicinamibacteria bacterium]
MLEQIGKYKILEKIGQGAMGEVYRAHDPVLNRDVAVKTISAELGADDTLRRRFEREAQSAARLNHPNIITVFDYGEEQGKIYMAMELLDGADLKQAIARRASLSLDEKLSIVDQIAEGLAFAHEHDIVHRDLKPANIHLLGNGQVKIMDFGLARLGGSEMTRAGMVMGTPHYMSPEQVRGERADSRSDVFALGCVFYEILTYRKPFDADSMHSVLFKVMQEEPPPVQDLSAGVPAVLTQVVKRAMSKDPAARFQNAGELRSALHRAMQAVASGQGGTALPELALPTTAAGGPPRDSATAASASRSASVSRSGSGARSASSSGPAAPSASGSRSASAAGRAPSRSSKAPLFFAAAAAVLALAVLAALVVGGRGSGTPSAPPASRPAQVDAFARELAQSQVELARRRAEGGDFREAMRQAERALKIDPDNKDAQAIFSKAKGTVDEVEREAAAARRASSAGDTGRAGDALWALIALEPDNPAVDEVAPRLESVFRPRAEEARTAMAQARQAAEASRAARVQDSFKDGTDLARQGESEFKAGRYATAARRFLAAREKFEHARRTVR